MHVIITDFPVLAQAPSEKWKYRETQGETVWWTNQKDIHSLQKTSSEWGTVVKHTYKYLKDKQLTYHAKDYKIILFLDAYVLSSHYLGVGDADGALYEAILFRGL